MVLLIRIQVWNRIENSDLDAHNLTFVAETIRALLSSSVESQLLLIQFRSMISSIVTHRPQFVLVLLPQFDIFWMKKPKTGDSCLLYVGLMFHKFVSGTEKISSIIRTGIIIYLSLEVLEYYLDWSVATI